MDQEQLRNAVLGAQQIQAPSGNPLGAANAPEIANFYRSSFQLPASNIASQGSAYNTEVTVANEKAAREAELKRQAKEAADMADPDKYTQKAKEDGGYDFFDPQGNQIDIATYSKVTGKNPVEIIKDSENPIDIQYREDWANMQDYMTAALSGDTKKKTIFEENSPSLKKYGGKGGPAKLLAEFKEYYRRYYNTRQQDPKAWGVKPQTKPLVPYPSEDNYDNALPGY